jgi:hypothetical protein
MTFFDTIMASLDMLLICLAIFVEIVAGAPEMPDDGR